MKTLLLFISFCAFSNEKVNFINLVKLKDTYSLEVFFENKVPPYTIDVKDNLIQIELAGTNIWPKIDEEKKVNETDLGKIIGYQYDKNISRVRFLPNDNFHSLRVLKEDSSRRRLLINFKMDFKKNNSKNVNNYLDNIIKSEDTKIKKVDSSFSYEQYIYKYVLAIIVVCGIFFIIVNIFKKKVFTRKKFIERSKNDTITILNKCYLSPKKSIALVKVNEKMIIIGESENNINYLTDVESPEKILKKIEKDLTGSNFESTIKKTKHDSVVEKEDIYVSSEKMEDDKINYANILKERIRKLKKLQ